MNDKKTVLLMGSVPSVPEHFRCPICHGRLTIEIDEWEEVEDGWRASDVGLHLSCATEPDIDSENWIIWHMGHFARPYIDWLPAQQKVFAWLDENYRFKAGLGLPTFEPKSNEKGPP